MTARREEQGRRERIAGVLARAALAMALAQGPLAATAGLSLAQSDIAELARAQVVKGETRVTTSSGYARIVLNLAEDVESEVKVAGGIVVVSFRKPVDVGIERIVGEAPDYISAARHDPDGRGLRIALARKVTVNSMAAGERLFIDLLPDTWKGMPPGLPQEVIEDLAKRAREAEKRLRLQRQQQQARKPPTVRVRQATQPTFTRYVFELPGVIPVTSERANDGLTLFFSAPLAFDLADVKASLPQAVRSIEADAADANPDGVAVRFAFNGKVDVRSFREDRSYIVDVSSADAKEAVLDPGAKLAALANADKRKGPMLAGVEAPQTVPATGTGGEKRDQAVSAPAPKTPQPAAAPAPVAGPQSAAPVGPPAKPVAKEASAADAAPNARLSGNPAAAEATAEKPAAPSGAQKPNADAAPNPAPSPAATPPAAAASTPAAPPAPRAAATTAHPDGTIPVELTHQGDNLRLGFTFPAPTPAAVFRRADTLWLVFDTRTPFDLAALNGDTSGMIRSVEVTPSRNGQILRLVLERPRLVSVGGEGDVWTITIGNSVAESTKPLRIARNLVGPKRASVTIPFDEPKDIHRVTDPEIGDSLIVVTALPPARGFLKEQDFVEFRALASTHGVVVQPIADDVHAELAADKIFIGRPNGLTLSNSAQHTQNAPAAPVTRAVLFDAQNWNADRQANFVEREYRLIGLAAETGAAKRTQTRVDLARFYMSRGMFAEAKGVLDVAIGDERPTAENVGARILRAIANIMLRRPVEALKDLADPLVGNQNDAPLWRALAHARQGQWADARTGFRSSQGSIAALPLELQRLALKEALRAAIEVRDFTGAADELREFEAVGLPPDMEPAVRVLSGRLAQGLGRNSEALKNYRLAADSDDRPAAAEGRLRELMMRYHLGDLKRPEMISDLETLTTLWRGDETEIEALQMLARLYTEEGRYRDAFYVMRTAIAAHPNSELTRRIQDEAAATFDALFLAGKGDSMPAVEALSLFYDFRELTPIGRRGDEMIRRLADRLVSVDLLGQAAELLQHQVDNRLQGAARAQVATRLAAIYLMNHKPDRALATLRSTRVADLATDLRNLRLMLEARALSDLGRHELALEVVANIDRREAVRLRADILWAAKRYAESAEQIELLYGDRWKQWEPLHDGERADILRAAVGYALGEDKIGSGRLRDKYAGKMEDTPDRRAFDVATAPLGSNAAEFREIAKKVASADTLDAFLREMRGRYPEIGAFAGGEARAPAVPATPPAGTLRTATNAQP
jgi:tetratricopeptide (TPR) repeat protein